MKRIFVFCLTLCLVLCGCVAAPEETEPSTSSTTESSETTLPLSASGLPEGVSNNPFLFLLWDFYMSPFLSLAYSVPDKFHLDITFPNPLFPI